MASKKINAALGTLPLLVLILLSLLAFPRKIDLTSSDLGRHIKNGEVYFKTGNIISTNFYSYTYPDFPTVNHHWLTGIVFYKIWQNLSFEGLSYLFLAVSISTTLIAYFSAKSNSNGYLALVPAIISTAFLARRFEIRPEIFSCFFIAAYYFLLNGYRKGRISKTWLLPIPLMQLLWTNLHIFFVMGWFIAGLFFIDALIQKETAKSQVFFLVLLLTLVTSFINPFGLKGVLEPFIIFNNYGIDVSENLSMYKIYLNLDRNTPILFAVAFVGLSSVSLLTIGPKKLLLQHFVETMLFLAYGILTIAVFRVISIFGLAVIFFGPVATQGLANFISREPRLVRFLKYSLEGFTFTLAFIIAIAAFAVPNYGIGLRKDNLAAVQFVKNNKIEGPMFNNYNNGGYTIFGLFPEYRVYVDNRPEAYPAEFLYRGLTKPTESDQAWERIYEEYKFNFILVNIKEKENTNEFAKRRLESPEWVPIFANEISLVMVRNSPNNQRLIDAYNVPVEDIVFPEKN